MGGHHQDLPEGWPWACWEPQLQRTYGLQPEGAVLPLEDLAHLDDAGREVAWALRQWQEHLAGAGARRRTARPRGVGAAWSVASRAAAWGVSSPLPEPARGLEAAGGGGGGGS